jgi:hypothetical protein
MQASKCAFLICSREDPSLEETAQEQLSSGYSQEMALKTLKPHEREQASPPQNKEIFSFKHKCFRNLPNSDKQRFILASGSGKAQETLGRLQNCRSS